MDCFGAQSSALFVKKVFCFCSWGFAPPPPNCLRLPEKALRAQPNYLKLPEKGPTRYTKKAGCLHT